MIMMFSSSFEIELSHQKLLLKVNSVAVPMTENTVSRAAEMQPVLTAIRVGCEDDVQIYGPTLQVTSDLHRCLTLH